MRKLFILLAALCCSISLPAVPAYRGLISHTQPDGTKIMIRQHGDEFAHWTTDASGRYLEKDAEGYYRPAPAMRIGTRRAVGQLRRSQANLRRRSIRARSGAVIGQKRFLVILVQFSDVKFKSQTANLDFANMMNLPGYSANGATGSARDFYFDNSHEDFEPLFDVYGPVTLENEMAHYGGNDENGYDLSAEYALVEGCELLDEQTDIDFSQYDSDNDGKVDLVFMYFAGYGEADSDVEDAIWPHQWELTNAGIELTLDGKKVDSYACSNELIGYGSRSGQMCGIGTACHEFGHAMGLPDFYDTDYEVNGESHGLYDYSLMCSGSYNNECRTPPYFNMEERLILGWVEAEDFRAFNASGNYTLTSVQNEVAYTTPTDQEGEYFVYECRSKTGWDSYIPQAGLIVYHVDKSSRDVSIMNYDGNLTNVSAADLWGNWGWYNAINENGEHPCFYIVPSGAPSNLNYMGSVWAFSGASGRSAFTATSWNGVASSVRLSNITYASNQITLYASVASNTLDYTVIANPGNGVYSAGSSFALSLIETQAQPVSSVLWYFDDEPVGGPSVTLPAGTHVVEAHLTLANGATRILELTITAN